MPPTGIKDPDELFVAGDGTIYVAPYGTTMPDDINDALDSAFVNVGYLTPDGFRMTPSIESEDIYGWQSDQPLRTVVTQRSTVLSLDFLQGNTAIFPIYFGGGTFSGTIFSAPSGSSIDQRSLVADVFDGSRSWRFMFPKVTLADARELAFTRSAAAQFGVDLKVLAVAGAAPFTFDRTDPEFYPGAYP